MELLYLRHTDQNQNPTDFEANLFLLNKHKYILQNWDQIYMEFKKLYSLTEDKEFFVANLIPFRYFFRIGYRDVPYYTDAIYSYIKSKKLLSQYDWTRDETLEQYVLFSYLTNLRLLASFTVGHIGRSLVPDHLRIAAKMKNQWEKQAFIGHNLLRPIDQNQTNQYFAQEMYRRINDLRNGIAISFEQISRYPD